MGTIHLFWLTVYGICTVIMREFRFLEVERELHRQAWSVTATTRTDMLQSTNNFVLEDHHTSSQELTLQLSDSNESVIMVIEAAGHLRYA